VVFHRLHTGIGKDPQELGCEYANITLRATRKRI
jgi:hypothetical protein